VAKHIQLPAVGAGIRLGIIIRAFVILIKVHYNRNGRTILQYDDGIAVLVGRTVWEHDTLLVRQELMTNQYFIGIDTDK
jgi:hypothetical protein